MFMDHFKPIVVAPTYNNAATLLDILRRIQNTGIPLLVVNDGSTDATAALLREFAGTTPRAGVTILTHPVNRGKAAAFRTAFKAARDAGYTHALTIDTDGQLDPGQIPAILCRARENPTALLLGVRDEASPDYPSRSRLGRRISNVLVRLESGLTVHDSQCGLRVYPLGFVLLAHCRAQRFGYETEILTRAGWAGCTVQEAPVSCVYLPPGQRVSHFRPVLDSVRAVLMHARLLCRALSPWPHVKWPQRNESWIPSWKSLMQWLSPREALRQLKRDEAGRTMFAAGLALGVFIANTPVYGVQTLVALYASRRLHLHPVPVVLGSQASMPPFGVAMIVLAIYVGHELLHGQAPAMPPSPVTLTSLAAMAPSLLLAWIVGSVIVGLVLGVLTFVISSLCFKLLLPRRQPQGVPVAVEAEA